MQHSMAELMRVGMLETGTACGCIACCTGGRQEVHVPFGHPAAARQHIITSRSYRSRFTGPCAVLAVHNNVMLLTPNQHTKCCFCTTTITFGSNATNRARYMSTRLRLHLLLHLLSIPKTSAREFQRISKSSGCPMDAS